MNVTIKNSTILINGSINIPFKNAMLIAPAPIDTMQNYSGSGLPFPNSEIAFENTPNKKIITNNSYNATFIYPNSYYIHDDLQPPVIHLVVDNKIIDKYVLPNILPLKTLTHRNMRFEDRSHFYGSKDYMLPIDTAENVMKTYKLYKSKYDIA